MSNDHFVGVSNQQRALWTSLSIEPRAHDGDHPRSFPTSVTARA
jgi:hypothetical protein